MQATNTRAPLPSILILSSAESEDNKAINDTFVAELNAKNADVCAVEWHNYHDVGLHIGAGKLEAFLVSDKRPLTDFTAVYFKSYFRYHEQATAIAEMLDAHGITFVGHELREYIPAYKLSQMARLSRAGLSVPETLFLPMEHYAQSYAFITAALGTPFIFKAIDGSTGNDNYLVDDDATFQRLVTENAARHFIAQRFIPNRSDMRVIIIGNAIKLVIERSRQNDATHLNNTSKGAQARLVPLAELPVPLQELALSAARTMKRDVAGVDLMLEAGTNQPYILEVNASPQIGSGAFEREKSAVYAQFFRELVS